MRKLTLESSIIIVILILIPLTLMGKDAFTIQLPEPVTSGGKPLMETLRQRASNRSFSTRPIPEQVLSNLLWAACGINRPAVGKRTAPSAVNWQEIEIYIAMKEGLFHYNARENSLEVLSKLDLRRYCGSQSFVAEAPMCLIYVADYSRMGDIPSESKDFYSAIDTGFISQNAYLFCASEGLSTVAVNMVDKTILASKMELDKDQKVILCQPFGYPD
ncbi:SagB/ThcOx family dehydrogenase [bacterium]|nr:SagB/ThcOx family dehydrogenase [bacterium]